MCRFVFGDRAWILLACMSLVGASGCGGPRSVPLPVEAEAPIAPVRRLPPNLQSVHAVLRVQRVGSVAIGSAFAWNSRLLLTNAHVVHGVPEGAEIAALLGLREVRVRLLRRSSTIDLALLCLPSDADLVAPPRRARPVAKGEEVFAVGPASLIMPQIRVQVRGWVLATGDADARFGPNWIARLPGAQRGFSGAPVVDQEGQLMGMLTGIRLANLAHASAFLPRRGSPPVAGPSGATEALILDHTAIRSEVGQLVESERLDPRSQNTTECMALKSE